jgi:hypothetical protein
VLLLSVPNAERLVRPEWTCVGFSGYPLYLEQWKVFYTETEKRFMSWSSGSMCVRTGRSYGRECGGVVVGVVAQVIITLGLAGEILAY